MPYTNWSTTPASNNMSPPNGFPEGMKASELNNSTRQLMADLAQLRDDIESGTLFDSPLDLSSATITLPADAVAESNINLDVVGQAEAEAGTETTTRLWTAERVAQAITALETTYTEMSQEEAEAGTDTDFQLVSAERIKQAIDALVPVHSFARLTYEVSSGVAGPNFSGGSWETIPLNTEATDPDSIVSLSSNAFTLSAGTYQVSATNSARGSSSAAREWRMRLRNTTDNATVLVSGTTNSTSGGGGGGGNHLSGVFSIAGTKSFEIQLYADAGIVGAAAVGTGENEVYNYVSILKVA